MAKKPKIFKHKKPPLPKSGDDVKYNDEEYWISEDGKVGLLEFSKNMIIKCCWIH